METTTSKSRRLDQIARAIVRDLRQQDDDSDHTDPTLSAEAAVQGWLDGARQAGDQPAACAIEYLGIAGAARTYTSKRGSSRVTEAEEDRLVAAVRRRAGL